MWRILVVDDNFLNRKLIVKILQDKADCDIASDGKEAIEAYEISKKENNPYDIILLDIAMPEVDGLEVLKTIRAQEKQDGVMLGDGVPIIMVTAYKSPFLEAFDQGCDDYILKPIFSEKLIAKIKEKLKEKMQK